MIKIDSKYYLPNFPLKLSVVEAFDFSVDPILILEQDEIGNFYLSYLTYLNHEDGVEIRTYVQVSKEKLDKIFDNKISVYKAFIEPENGSVYTIDYDLHSGDILNVFLIPRHSILEYNLIQDWYDYEFTYCLKDVEVNNEFLLNYSEKKQNLIVDFYLQSHNLKSSIKPYAFFKIFTPLIDILKNLIGFDSRNADKYLEFSNIRQASLGITIEVNFSNDLFLEKEDSAINTIVSLIDAQNEEEFKEVIYSTKDTTYIKNYSLILKAVIDNDAVLNTAYANPITKNVKHSVLNKEKAKVVKSIIDQTFEVIEDIEIIEGLFREIDIEAKEPSFKIYYPKEDISLRGKFETSLLQKIQNDYINIGKETYKFTLKTIYYPETTVKAEETKRFIIDYELTNNKETT